MKRFEYGGVLNALGKVAFASVVGLVFLSREVFAFNQPPVNLSITTFLDAGAPPGLSYVNYSIFTEGREAVDNNGDVIPGNAHANVLALAHQFVYISNAKLLGANLSMDVILTVSAATVKGSLGPMPIQANTAGLGDMIVGPTLVWNGKMLLGSPVFHRLELQTTLPTGKYDKNAGVNPGFNLTTFNPYYSFVWMFRQKWETSWRFYYAMHSTNDDSPFGKVKPGNAFHANYAVSRELLPFLRLGVAGYYFQQLSEDKINGVTATNSKERVMAVGPGLVLFSPGGNLFALSHPVEFGVKNRFKGSRTTLQIISKF